MEGEGAHDYGYSVQQRVQLGAMLLQTAHDWTELLELGSDWTTVPQQVHE